MSKAVALFIFVLFSFCSCSTSYPPVKMPKAPPAQPEVKLETLEPAKETPAISVSSFSVPSYIAAERNEVRSIHVFIDHQLFAAYEYGKLVFWGPVSTADKKHRTPLGTFRIDYKDAKHVSRDPECPGVPMPLAQRLGGTNIYFHVGKLPGWPDSHGCIRLKLADARKLFAWTKGKELVVISRK